MFRRHFSWLGLSVGAVAGLAVLAFAAADFLSGAWQPEWWLDTATRGVRVALFHHRSIAGAVGLGAALVAVFGASASFRVPLLVRSAAVVLSSIAVLSLVLTPAYYSPEIRAWTEAHRDIRRGTIQYFSVGQVPLSFAPVEAQLFRERLGVRLHHLGSIPPANRWRYAETYNAVVTPAVERRFGKDIIGRTQEEAYASYHHPEAPPRQ